MSLLHGNTSLNGNGSVKDFVWQANGGSRSVNGRSKFWQMHGVGLQNAEGLIETLTPGQVLAFEPILR